MQPFRELSQTVNAIDKPGDVPKHVELNTQTLTEAIRVLQKRVTGLETEKLFLQHTNAAIQRELTTLKTEQDVQLQKLQTEFTNRTNKSNTALKNAQDEASSLKAELEERMTLQHSLSAQLSQAQRQAAQAQGQLESLRTQASSEIKMLHETIEKLNQRICLAEKDKAVLSSEIEKLKQDASLLKQKIAEEEATKQEAMTAVRRVIGLVNSEDKPAKKKKKTKRALSASRQRATKATYSKTQQCQELVRSLERELTALADEKTYIMQYAQSDPIGFARNSSALERLKQLNAERIAKTEQISAAKRLL